MGLLFFYTAAAFDAYNGLPNWIYYFWNKGLDFMKWVVIYKLVDGRMRWVVKPVLIFALIRFIWDIVSYFTGLKVNNSVVVAILFMLLVTIFFYLFLKELIKWQRLK